MTQYPGEKHDNGVYKTLGIPGLSFHATLWHHGSKVCGTSRHFDAGVSATSGHLSGGVGTRLGIITTGFGMTSTLPPYQLRRAYFITEIEIFMITVLIQLSEVKL